MKTLSAINDPVFTSRTYNSFDRFFLRYLKDERDLPFVYLTLRITFILIPLAVALFVLPLFSWVWWTVAAVHFYVSNLAISRCRGA